jgi:signal transduction histidine kinase/CheY-like chemotaxis protein/HAMP domain-containing protein
VGTVFLAIAPALVFLYFTNLPKTGFAVGLLALAAAWVGGERFVLRHVRRLVAAVRKLGSGDLASRTGLGGEAGEIGALARAFDQMAASLQQRVAERERAEQRSFNRALHQTAVAALGQFALTSGDFGALLNQAVLLVSQTLEIDLCWVLELEPGRKEMLVQAGAGWKKGTAGAGVNAEGNSQAAHTLTSGEPVVIPDLKAERRFRSEPLLAEHEVVSAVTVAIGARDKTFGVLGAYAKRRREFAEDDVQFLLGMANVLGVAAERCRAEAEVEKLAAFARLNPNPVMEFAPDATITYSNQAALRLALSAGRRHPSEILPPEIQALVQSCLATNQSQWNLETRLENRVLSWSLHPVLSRRVVHCYVTDITERLSLEAQLRQSQKMESVGQLAAGVAHDFNNMLTVIQGHAGILMARPSLPPELRDSVQSVYFAAERAAGLTRQLLTFSRKSVMQPKLLDLREVVSNMSKMLKRLLGETVSLEFSPPPEIPLIRADAGMIEQVLMNLAVNARDAMPGGGKLIVAIQPVTLDSEYVQTHSEARIGPFVFLRVTDTGCGMDAQTRNRIFEPFFTTKEPGKGTGLGLATVYGIIRQHEGWIDVTSELGKGTTFGIFFPATAETTAGIKPSDPLAESVRGGNEIILLVEDEPAILKMGKLILQDCGYRVLEAYSGNDGLDLWQRNEGRIDLLLTDVVMPEGLSGLELAQQLLGQRPQLKVLFTSGYNVNYLDTELLGKCGGVFLQKPYTRSTLAKAVRACLDGKA